LTKRLKNIVNSEEKKRLLSNFFSLSVLQGANYILPLITLPYLVRVLGLEYFGLLAFATAMIAYFNVITDYGFNLTATREISIHRDNREKVIEIFSSVMIIKFILMIFSFIFMSILVFSFDKLSTNWEVYFLTFGTVIGQVLFPVWFFQGMERMKYITYLNILAKSIFTLAIFVFIHEQSDFWIVPLLTSVGFLIVGVWSLVLVKKNFNISFKLQKIDLLKIYLIDGWHIFLSQVNVSLFSNSNIIILGLFSNNTAVGYYSLAEKIMKTVARAQIPVTATIFPYISNLIKKNKKQAIAKLKKIIVIGTILYFILLGLIAIFSEQIILMFFGNEAINSVIVLQIIIIIPWTIFLNNIFGTQIMLNIGQSKEFLNILFIGAIINLLLCSMLSYYYSYIGTAVSLLLVEIFIMLGMFYYVKKDLL
jgi:polysaccharide transporter, PST family